jgi:hypothetical protein
MSNALMQGLVDSALAQTAKTNDVGSDALFKQSEQSAKPLAQFLQNLRRQTKRQLEITKERQDKALFFYTNLLLPAQGKTSLRYSLFFAVRGNELYSNLRNPAVHPDSLFYASSAHANNRVVGLSQVQLFSLIRQLAAGQGYLADQRPSTAEASYAGALAQARPVISALRSLRQQTGGKFGFSLTRVHNALCVKTNLTIDLPYDDQGAATYAVSLDVGPKGFEAHYLQQFRGLKGPEPITAQEFLGEVAKLAVARHWIKPKP